MVIRNKFLRFLASIGLMLISYFIFVLIWMGSDNIVEGVILVFVFGMIIVLPILIGVTVFYYILLTDKNPMSNKRNIVKMIKYWGIFLGVCVLLAFLSMYTDLLDNLF